MSEGTNSCDVHIEFKSPLAAKRFYFGAPGACLCVGTRVGCCIEGDKEQADMLERFARKQQYVVAVTIERYNVET